MVRRQGHCRRDDVRRRAAADQRRRGAPRANDREPPPERGEVHAGWWSGRGQHVCRYGEGAGHAPDRRYRSGYRAGDAPTIVPAVHAGRGDAGSSKGGLGFGLALVKGLVEMHGGEVCAHSDGPGKGAEFVVELPLDVTAAAEAGSAAARTATRRRRVLIIEDNIDTADSLKRGARVWRARHRGRLRRSRGVGQGP